MTGSYFLQLNNTDNLETVIKKCNTNFGNFSSTANRSTSGTSADIDLTSLIDDIEAERLAREAADTDLDVLKAPLASPALTGTPTAPTAAAGTNTTQIATTAFVMAAIASAGGGGSTGALQYKGTVDAESTITGANYEKGWYYVVTTAGTYVGHVCEVGDMLIAKQDKTGTPANDWDAVQSNIETLSNNEIDALWAAA